MELLIPGLLLVGLMYYASTRIKKSAALALESERVATPDFTIEKPKGFISVAAPEDGLLFRAYTKEFADEGRSKSRCVVATVRRVEQQQQQRPAARDGARIFERGSESIAEITKTLKTGAHNLLLTIESPADERERWAESIDQLVETFSVPAAEQS